MAARLRSTPVGGPPDLHRPPDVALRDRPFVVDLASTEDAAFERHRAIGPAVRVEEMHRTGAAGGKRVPEGASHRNVGREGVGRGAGEVADHRAADGEAAKDDAGAVDPVAGDGVVAHGLEEGDLVARTRPFRREPPAVAVPALARRAVRRDDGVAARERRVDEAGHVQHGLPARAPAVQEHEGGQGSVGIGRQDDVVAAAVDRASFGCRAAAGRCRRTGKRGAKSQGYGRAG